GGAHDRDPVGDGGRGGARREDRRDPARARRRGALPRRARARARGDRRGPARADRPHPPLAFHRGRGEPLQGARSGARGAALAADRGLPRPARGVPRQGRSGAGAARAAAARASDPAGLASRRRPSPLRVRRLGQLTSVLDPALDGAPDGAEGDGLRDVAISRVGRRVSDLLGDRGLAGRPGLWRGVGPGLRAVASALGRRRLPVLGGRRPPQGPPPIQRLGAPPRARRLAPPLPLGSFTFDAPGTVSVRQRVVRDALVDYGVSLARAGFRYILVANGHAGPGHLAALDEAAATVSRRYGISMASFTGHLAW